MGHKELKKSQIMLNLSKNYNLLSFWVARGPHKRIWRATCGLVFETPVLRPCMSLLVISKQSLVHNLPNRTFSLAKSEKRRYLTFSFCIFHLFLKFSCLFTLYFFFFKIFDNIIFACVNICFCIENFWEQLDCKTAISTLLLFIW